MSGAARRGRSVVVEIFITGIFITGSILAASPRVRFADPAAKQAFERTQSAIAATRSVEEIRTLSMHGRLRVPTERDAPIDGEVLVRVALPDRFMRADTIGRDTRRSGRSAPERAAFVRLLLGIAALAAGDRDLTIKSSGEDAFPDTRSFDVDAGSWSARFVVDAQSGLPLRIVDWSRQRGATITSFADRRLLDGYLLPHRITVTTADRVLETLMFDDIQINPRLSDEDFKP